MTGRREVEECESPEAVTPKSRRRQVNRHAKRRATARKNLERELQALAPADLATVLDGIPAADAKRGTLIDVLFHTAPVWLRKIDFAKQLVQLHNKRWNAVLCVRMQGDYHLGSRVVDAMRYDWSHDLESGSPRRSVLIVNPHRAWDTQSYVHFAQPFPSRAIWAPLQRMESARFQLILPEPCARDVTQRDFLTVVQNLVERDRMLLATTSHIGLVLGFDGADDVCHFLVRLDGYKREVKAESEAKGAQLAIACNSDDHYPALVECLGPKLGPSIDAARRGETTIEVDGVRKPMRLFWCLDLSASRSLYGRRTNASPHSEKLHPHLVLPHPVKITWAEADRAIERAMPWLDVETLHLDAHAPRDSELPFACSRPGCCFKLKDVGERDAYLQSIAAARTNRSKTGIKEYAKIVAAHAPLHGLQLPGQSPLTTIPPSHNLVDLLHGMDINLGDKLVKYTYMDPLIPADRPDARESIFNFYLSIQCYLDVREADPGKQHKSWFHGSVWHYDYVMGANRKSYGLKLNAFICNLIVYGIADEDIEIAEERGVELVDDIPTQPKKKSKNGSRAKAAQEPVSALNSVDAFLKLFFGHHAARVRSNFEATDAYGTLFTAMNDEWTADDKD